MCKQHRKQSGIITQPNILYICQNAIGDIIVTLPSIHFLRRLHPQGRLDVFLGADYTDIFAGDHNVDSIIAAPNEWFCPETICSAISTKDRPIFHHYYDIVVDSMSISQTAELIGQLRPGKAVGIDFDETAQAYDQALSLENWQAWKIGDRNVSECFADIIRLLSVECRASQPVLYVTEKAQEIGKAWMVENNPRRLYVVALNPGAGHPMKRWPMEDFMNLAAYLKKSGLLPLFIFGPKEVDLYQAYSQSIETLGGIVYQSTNYRIQTLAGILQQCDLLVSNDCAVMHVGAAIGCRVVAIFGPTNPDIWFPYSSPKGVAVGGCNARNTTGDFPSLIEVQKVTNEAIRSFL